jgi:hypothetical protein
MSSPSTPKASSPPAAAPFGVLSPFRKQPGSPAEEKALLAGLEAKLKTAIKNADRPGPRKEEALENMQALCRDIEGALGSSAAAEQTLSSRDQGDAREAFVSVFQELCAKLTDTVMTGTQASRHLVRALFLLEKWQEQAAAPAADEAAVTPTASSPSVSVELPSEGTLLSPANFTRHLPSGPAERDSSLPVLDPAPQQKDPAGKANAAAAEPPQPSPGCACVIC